MLRVLLISAAATCAAPALAEGVEDVIRLDVLPGWRTPDGTHVAALRLRLAPGWKTFWRAPGDAGIPARFALEGSDNLVSLEPVWPTPDVFDVAGLRTLGYAGELVLPLRVTASDATAPIRLEGQVELGICRDICIPATLDVAALLPADGAPDAAIRGALIDVPYSAAEAGVSDIVCATGPVQYGIGFRAEITLPRMGGSEMVVVEPGDPMIWVAETRSWWEGDTLIAETEMSHLEKPGLNLASEAVTITILGGGQAVEILGCPRD